MNKRTQKVAIVTGGSQGIGAGLVDGHRQRGWAVVANSLDIKPSKDPDVRRGVRVMSGYTKWGRAAYVERVGGQEEAERRRKELMARQTGYRLAEERKRHGLTQAQLAETMGVTPGRVSQVERGELATIEAVARYVEALGGRLDLIASFGDHTLTVTTTEAA